MAKCYRCDSCGVVTILKIPVDLNDYDDSNCNDYYEPAMTIYTKNKTYDICANCASRIMNAIERKNVADEFLKN